jgi:hypothetical protein
MGEDPSRNPPIGVTTVVVEREEAGFLRTQGCRRSDENSHLSEDASTRSPCYDPILVMKGQVSVKPTSELLIADKMFCDVSCKPPSLLSIFSLSIETHIVNCWQTYYCVTVGGDREKKCVC